MKTFRVEILTAMVVDAVDALAAVAEVRYHFSQMCKLGGGVPGLARDAKYDVTVTMCSKCWSHECDGKCESQRRVPVIQQRDRE